MLFRYAGGKGKLRKEILPYIIKKIQDKNIKKEDFTYIEPFFGAGGFFDSLSYLVKNIHLNDYDQQIVSVWNSILFFPESLKEEIIYFTPNTKDFFEFKDLLLSNKNFSIIHEGFLKIALHQMSYSGLGVKAGGPIGGINQSSKYDVGCRWNAKSLCNKIDKFHKLFSGLNLKYNQFTNFDFRNVIDDSKENDIIYLDPPYFVKGKELYKNSFNLQDHLDLRNLLINKKNWVLSYDNCAEIKEMYDFAELIEFNAKYSINGSINKTELIIVPKEE